MERRQKEQMRHFFLLALIIILAIVVRTWNLENAPPGLYPDEAYNATNAFDALKNHAFRWFYPDNNGREGGYINLMALGFSLFGVATWTIKLPSVFFGVLTVICVYGATRELFRSRPTISLISAYLIAVSFWAIDLSRVAFRAQMMLPFLCLTIMFLLRGKRTNKLANYALAGIACGIGFNTYLAFRIMPVFLLALLLLFIQVEKGFVKRSWKAILLFVICMSVVVAPLGFELYQNPDNISARTGDVSIFNEEHRKFKLPFESTASVHGVPTAMAGTILLSLSKYNLFGDRYWRHGYPPYPVLEPLVGLVFLAGGFGLMRGFWRAARHRPKLATDNDVIVINGLLIFWFVLFLVPEFMTTVGLPSALRSIGTLPAVYIFAAYAMHVFLNTDFSKADGSGLGARLKQHLHSRHTRKLLLMMFLAYVGCFNIVKYHVFWASRPEVAIGFNKELRDMAYAIKEDDSTQIFTLLRTWEFQTVRIYNEDKSSLINLNDDSLEGIVPNAGTVIYFPLTNTELVEQAKQYFGTDRIRVGTTEDANGLGFYKIAFQP